MFHQIPKNIGFLFGSKKVDLHHPKWQQMLDDAMPPDLKTTMNVK